MCKHGIAEKQCTLCTPVFSLEMDKKCGVKKKTHFDSNKKNCWKKWTEQELLYLKKELFYISKFNFPLIRRKITEVARVLKRTEGAVEMQYQHLINPKSSVHRSKLNAKIAGAVNENSNIPR